MGHYNWNTLNKNATASYWHRPVEMCVLLQRAVLDISDFSCRVFRGRNCCTYVFFSISPMLEMSVWCWQKPVSDSVISRFLALLTLVELLGRPAPVKMPEQHFIFCVWGLTWLVKSNHHLNRSVGTAKCGRPFFQPIMCVVWLYAPICDVQIMMDLGEWIIPTLF